MLALAALAVIAGTNLADTPVNRAYANATEAWATCIVQTARNWARLAQPVETIALGALGKCHPLQEQMEDRTATMFLETMNPVEAQRRAHQLIAEAAAEQKLRLIAAILELIATQNNMTH